MITAAHWRRLLRPARSRLVDGVVRWRRKDLDAVVSTGDVRHLVSTTFDHGPRLRVEGRSTRPL